MNRCRSERSCNKLWLSLFIVLVAVRGAPASSSSAPPPPATPKQNVNLQKKLPPPPPPNKKTTQSKSSSLLETQERRQRPPPPPLRTNLPNRAISHSVAIPPCKTVDAEKRKPPPPPPPKRPTNGQAFEIPNDGGSERLTQSKKAIDTSSGRLPPATPTKPKTDVVESTATLESKQSNPRSIIPPPPPPITDDGTTRESITESKNQAVATSKTKAQYFNEGGKAPLQGPVISPPRSEKLTSRAAEVANQPSISEMTSKARKPPPPPLGELRQNVTNKRIEDTSPELKAEVTETRKPPPPPPTRRKSQRRESTPLEEQSKPATTASASSQQEKSGESRSDSPSQRPPPPPPTSRVEQKPIRTVNPSSNDLTESSTKLGDGSTEGLMDIRKTGYSKAKEPLVPAEQEHKPLHGTLEKENDDEISEAHGEAEDVTPAEVDSSSTLQSGEEATSPLRNVTPSLTESIPLSFSSAHTTNKTMHPPNESLRQSSEIKAQNVTHQAAQAEKDSGKAWKSREAIQAPNYPPPPPPAKVNFASPKAELSREHQPNTLAQASSLQAPSRQYPQTAGDDQNEFVHASRMQQPQQGSLPAGPMNQQSLHTQGSASQRPRPLPPGKRYDSRTGYARIQSPPPPGRGTPAVRSFWSKIEKGLDGLANLEDTITGRAQQLVSKTINNKSMSQPQPTPPPRQRRSIRQQYTTEPLMGPRLRWQRQQSSTANPKTIEKSTDQSAPSVTVHSFRDDASSLAGPEVGSVTSSSTPPSQAGKNGRSESLSARQLMPANGGASNPRDNSSWIPGSGRFSQNSLTSSNQGNAQPDRDGAADSAPNKSPVIPERIGQRDGSGVGVPQQRWSQPGTKPGPSPPAPQRGRDAGWSQAQSMNQGPLAAFSQGATTSISTTRPPTYPDDDDDDDKPSLFSRMFSAIPVPPIGKLFRYKRGKLADAYAFDVWDAQDEENDKGSGLFRLFHRQKKSKSDVSSKQVKQSSNHVDIPRPVQSLLERCDEAKTASLLRPVDKRKIRRIGKSRAMLDVIALSLVLVAIRQIQGLEMVPFPTTLNELSTLTLPSLFSCLAKSLDSWAPLAFAAAILAVVTNSLLFDGRIQKVASNVATAAESEASYARLFVRLILSTPSERSISVKVAKAAHAQVLAMVDLSRLRSFVTFTVSIIILMTVAFVRPFILTALGSIIHLVTLPELRKWPLPTHHILSNIRDTMGGLGKDLKSMIEVELRGAGHHPMQVAFKASILAALVAVAYLPALEARRKVETSDATVAEDTDGAVQIMSEQLENLGASSASRLGVLSKAGCVENLIERWRMMTEELSETESDISIGNLVRRLGYRIAAWCLLAAPILLFGFFCNTPITGWSATQMPRWESLLEVSVLLFFANARLSKTIAKVVESTSMRSACATFLNSVSRASAEATKSTGAPRLFSGSSNPTAGLLIKDLWAAHEVKRAWAIRAAHLSCRAGEVVLVLADDGGGKTKLLTTIAESIVSPPKEALTARIQRGSVSLGGIDVTKWDRNQLKKRVGLFLHDINAIPNMAGLWSGLSLEEILEPGDELKVSDPTHASGSVEKSCMIRALKITGLYWTLLPRLPTKLSSVVTANEEDLRPSPVRPRCYVLSPTEWSKLMLAKLLAQALYDNENASGPTDQLDGSLVGTLFLLDDATMLMSEIEEAKLLQDLRRTGAATVLSSNKWATGRLADRIVVMKDGTVIESGTHNELLSRGPQQSVYAAKWQALTSF